MASRAEILFQRLAALVLGRAAWPGGLSARPGSDAPFRALSARRGEPRFRSRVSPHRERANQHLEFGDPAPLADVSSASGRPLSAWGRSANAHPRPIVDGRWHSGSLSAAESRAGLNRAVLSHNPEVAGSNPAPATKVSAG